jgi:hypothetical protein
MRVRHAWVLVLAMAAGCGSDASGPGGTATELARGAGTLLTGGVLGVRPGPDSTTVAVRGAEIMIIRVDSVPTDTVPVDSTPGDTMLWNGLALRPFMPDSGIIDSLPTDTLPPDTIPVDTIPPDTNPPPPVPDCGRTGEVVARVTTGETGRFRIAGLLPGKYDLQISPPSGSAFGATVYCGVHLLPRQPAELRIFLPPKWGAD